MTNIRDMVSSRRARWLAGEDTSICKSSEFEEYYYRMTHSFKKDLDEGREEETTEEETGVPPGGETGGTGEAVSKYPVLAALGLHSDPGAAGFPVYRAGEGVGEDPESVAARLDKYYGPYLSLVNAASRILQDGGGKAIGDPRKALAGLYNSADFLTNRHMQGWQSLGVDRLFNMLDQMKVGKGYNGVLTPLLGYHSIYGDDEYMPKSFKTALASGDDMQLSNIVNTLLGAGEGSIQQMLDQMAKTAPKAPAKGATDDEMNAYTDARSKYDSQVGYLDNLRQVLKNNKLALDEIKYTDEAGAARTDLGTQYVGFLPTENRRGGISMRDAAALKMLDGYSKASIDIPHILAYSLMPGNGSGNDEAALGRGLVDMIVRAVSGGDEETIASMSPIEKYTVALKAYLTEIHNRGGYYSMAGGVSDEDVEKAEGHLPFTDGNGALRLFGRYEDGLFGTPVEGTTGTLGDVIDGMRGAWAARDALRNRNASAKANLSGGGLGVRELTAGFEPYVDSETGDEDVPRNMKRMKDLVTRIDKLENGDRKSMGGDSTTAEMYRQLLNRNGTMADFAAGKDGVKLSPSDQYRIALMIAANSMTDTGPDSVRALMGHTKNNGLAEYFFPRGQVNAAYSLDWLAPILAAISSGATNASPDVYMDRTDRGDTPQVANLQTRGGRRNRGNNNVFTMMH